MPGLIQAGGYVRENGSQMLVSFGAAWPAFRVRIFARTEANC
jgi:hypothetical protein